MSYAFSPPVLCVVLVADMQGGVSAEVWQGRAAMPVPVYLRFPLPRSERMARTTRSPMRTPSKMAMPRLTMLLTLCP